MPQLFLSWLDGSLQVGLWWAAVASMVLLLLLLAAFGMRSFMASDFSLLLPIRILRIHGQLSSGRLYMPLLNALLAVFECGNSTSAGIAFAAAYSDCNGPGVLTMKVFSVLLATALLALASLLSLVFYEANPLSGQLISKAHGRQDLQLVLVVTVVTLTSTIFRASLSPIFVASVTLLGALLLVCGNTFFLPSYSHLMNVADGAIYGMFAFASMCGVLNEMYDATDAGFTFYGGVICAGIAGVMLVHLRLSHVLMSPPWRLLTPYDVEIKARIALHHGLYGHPTSNVIRHNTALRLLRLAIAVPSHLVWRLTKAGRTRRNSDGSPALGPDGEEEDPWSNLAMSPGSRRPVAVQPAPPSAAAGAARPEATAITMTAAGAGAASSGAGAGTAAGAVGSKGGGDGNTPADDDDGASPHSSPSPGAPGDTAVSDDQPQPFFSSKKLTPAEIERRIILRTRTLLEDVAALYRASLGRFKHSAMLRIFAARFFGTYIRNSHLHTSMLMMAERLSPSLDVSYLLFAARRANETEAAGVDRDLSVIQRVKFEKHSADAWRLVRKAALRQAAFWAELCKPAGPDLARLHSLGSQLSDAMLGADAAFRDVFAINAASITMMRLYAGYLRVVRCNPEAAALYELDAARLDEQVQRGLRSETSPHMRFLEPGTFPMALDSAGLLRVRADGAALGTIINANKAAVRLFGFGSRLELERRTFFSLMPPDVGAAHADALRHYDETGEGELVDTTRTGIGIDKQGAAFALGFDIRSQPPDEGVPQFRGAGAAA